MITTIYQCDRCGHEQSNDTQMWSIAIAVEHRAHIYNATSFRAQKYWCRACGDKFNLVVDPPKPSTGEPQKPEVTFEDKLREIIREEIEAAK